MIHTSLIGHTCSLIARIFRFLSKKNIFETKKNIFETKKNIFETKKNIFETKKKCFFCTYVHSVLMIMKTFSIGRSRFLIARLFRFLRKFTSQLRRNCLIALTSVALSK
jgi:hypothetical protein